MVKVLAAPLQLTLPLVKEGVTVMVAVSGAVPAFTAAKVPILPFPVAANPIEVLLFVQVYETDPAVLDDVKSILGVFVPLQ